MSTTPTVLPEPPDIHRPAPLVRLGQGTLQRNYFPEDLGMPVAEHTRDAPTASTHLLEAELIGAALRYAAVADWFEARPLTRHRREGEQDAMDAFNHVEVQLREAGRRLLRRLGHRELVLEQALREATAS